LQRANFSLEFGVGKHHLRKRDGVRPDLRCLGKIDIVRIHARLFPSPALSSISSLRPRASLHSRVPACDPRGARTPTSAPTGRLCNRHFTGGCRLEGRLWIADVSLLVFPDLTKLRPSLSKVILPDQVEVPSLQKVIPPDSMPLSPLSQEAIDPVVTQF
jgi:hypothetical protein